MSSSRPYERSESVRGTPNLTGASATADYGKKMLQASCELCGLDFAMYEEGTEKPRLCERHEFLSWFFEGKVKKL